MLADCEVPCIRLAVLLAIISYNAVHADTYTILADLAMEQENFESAVDDYRKAQDIILSSQDSIEVKSRSSILFPEVTEHQ